MLGHHLQYCEDDLLPRYRNLWIPSTSSTPSSSSKHHQHAPTSFLNFGTTPASPTSKSHLSISAFIEQDYNSLFFRGEKNKIGKCKATEAKILPGAGASRQRRLRNIKTSTRTSFFNMGKIGDAVMKLINYSPFGKPNNFYKLVTLYPQL